MDYRDTGIPGGTPMRLAATLVLALAAQCAQAADAGIGRIFYTPEQRVQLDSLRTQRIVATQVREEPAPEVVTYQGIVRRSDGKATVWVNNAALSDAELRNGQSLVGSIGRDGQVVLQTPQAAIRLKVGQSAELLSGQVNEPYAVQRTSPPQLEPKTRPEPAATKVPIARPPDAARPDAPLRPPAAQP